jgi:hypothetical protein
VIGARAAVLALLALLAGCGSETAEAPRAEPEIAAREPEVQEAPAYEAHEWGLLGYPALGQGPALAAASPLVESAGYGAGYAGGGSAYAPVLYAHLAGGARELTFDVSVGVDARTIVETWPQASGAGWRRVRAREAPSEGCGASYPTIDQPACQSVRDQYCEAMNAHHYEASDGACLEVGGRSYDHLLYRAEVARDALPVDVAREDGAFVVRARGGDPIRLVRIRRSFTLGTIEAVAFESPSSGSIPLPEPQPSDIIETQHQLYAELERAGLSEPERMAFRTAWSDAIVPERSEMRFPIAQRMRLAPAVRPPRDAVYYWLPRERADAILPLSFTPAPRAVRRALLVRISLDETEPVLPPPSREVITTRVEVTRTSARGLVSDDVVLRVVRRNLGQVRFCQQRLGAAVPSELTCHAELTPSGTPSGARCTLSVANEDVDECTSEALGRWAFPAPEPPEGASVDFTIALSEER